MKFEPVQNMRRMCSCKVSALHLEEVSALHLEVTCCCSV